jgi:hypothetical protein
MHSFGACVRLVCRNYSGPGDRLRAQQEAAALDLYYLRLLKKDKLDIGLHLQTTFDKE